VSDGTRTRDRLDHNRRVARADWALNTAREAGFVRVSPDEGSSIIPFDTGRYPPVSAPIRSLGPSRNNSLSRTRPRGATSRSERGAPHPNCRTANYGRASRCPRLVMARLMAAPSHPGESETLAWIASVFS
jgi:hypothetical protein